MEEKIFYNKCKCGKGGVSIVPQSPRAHLQEVGRVTLLPLTPTVIRICEAPPQSKTRPEPIYSRKGSGSVFSDPGSRPSTHTLLWVELCAPYDMQES